MERRPRPHLAARCGAELERPLPRRLVRGRARTGKRQADGTGLRVRAAAEAVVAAAEHLRLRLQLDVDLEADDWFPLRHRGTPSPRAAVLRCRRAPRRSRGTPPERRACG